MLELLPPLPVLELLVAAPAPSNDAICWSSSIFLIFAAHASTLLPPTPVRGSMSQRVLRFSSLAVTSFRRARNCLSYAVRFAALSKRHRPCIIVLSSRDASNWTTMRCSQPWRTRMSSSALGASATMPSPTKSTSGSWRESRTESPDFRRSLVTSVPPGNTKTTRALFVPGSRPGRLPPLLLPTDRVSACRTCSSRTIQPYCSRFSGGLLSLCFSALSSTSVSRCKSATKWPKYAAVAASLTCTRPRSSVGCTFSSAARASWSSEAAAVSGWGPASFAGALGGACRSLSTGSGSPSSRTARSSSSVAFAGIRGIIWPSLGSPMLSVSRTMPVGTGMRETRMTNSFVNVSTSSLTPTCTLRPSTSPYCAGPALRAASSRSPGSSFVMPPVLPVATKRLAAANAPGISPAFSLDSNNFCAFLPWPPCAPAHVDAPHFFLFGLLHFKGTCSSLWRAFARSFCAALFPLFLFDGMLGSAQLDVAGCFFG
mmetsp:Transcript_18016/g.57153  ORF Transcript_18016/g.57153 Transcript_18016/m.57153 type:complete len:485 (+) Transcript_18016:1671-3125(+)